MRYGADSMDLSQAETVPGLQPRRGPTPANDGSFPFSTAREGRRTTTGILYIVHWISEGARMPLRNQAMGHCRSFKREPLPPEKQSVQESR